MSKRKSAAEAVRVSASQLMMVPVGDLVPYANNARRHSSSQIAQLRASLREFGFVTPILVDEQNNIIAGHGRVEAARAEGMTKVPCVLVTDLTETQRRAYILADNRLSETASWDEPILQIELSGLRALNFNVDVTGFAMAEDGRIHVSDYERAPAGAGASPDYPSAAAPLDLDGEPQPAERDRQSFHCPKCGFVFEVDT